MQVAIVVPWRDGCPHRERAWAWLQGRYAERHPKWPVIEAPGPDGPWIKAAAVTPVLERVDAGIVVVADADAWSDHLAEAVESVSGGTAPWAIPYRRVHRLTEHATNCMLAGVPPDDLPLAEPPYNGFHGGGIVIARRDTIVDIPLDPRFVGWGGEDWAWGQALTTIAGPPAQLDGPLWHLWHPPQARRTRRLGSPANEALRRRYAMARRHPERMRALIDETRGG